MKRLSFSTKLFYYGIVPIIPALLAFFCYSKVSISRKSHAKTSAELEAMRSSTDSEM